MLSEAQTSPDESRPNFVFGGNRVISEQNWAQFQAQGVQNIVESIDEEDVEQFRETLQREAQGIGVENLLLGDAFDRVAERPLRHKRGVGLYATAAGLRREEVEATAGRLPGRPIRVLPDGRHIVARPGAKRIYRRQRRHPSAESS